MIIDKEALLRQLTYFRDARLKDRPEQLEEMPTEDGTVYLFDTLQVAIWLVEGDRSGGAS
ncbi:hypothetical protein [Taklimakanibacter albus]|uniref:Uncharacterized protein n=1 Tax=Taklimakanibacter albus TaxID=2800327 RepID=A0ACC5R6I3_9HYPH|nr:hypothetical protein [Aestuariivirga sp. YIM B02566]MBK1868279.1 hypothetical protein [Aestuariivirga sp. YIM B02566]